MQPITLSDIVKATGGRLRGPADGAAAFTDVCTDTRTLAPGDLFLALRGESFDGHDFLPLAQKKGAAGIVAAADAVIPAEVTLPVVLVGDTLAALQDLAAWYRARFTLPVAAVTGSSGKTTTKDMLATVLSARYRVYATAKNYNNHIGLPKTLLGLEPSHEAAVLELGMNHAGEIGLLARIAKPTAALITGIGTAHIEHLGSRENILRAKLEVLEGLDPDGTLILNGDDDLLAAIGAAALPQRVLFISAAGRRDAFLRAEDVTQEADSTAFTAVTAAGETQRVTLPVIGRHNVTDALLAMAHGLTLGLTLAEMARALAGYVPSSLRGEVFRLGAVTLIKDYYNANPESVRASLLTLAETPGSGRRVAVVGEMLELGAHAAAAHREIGALCASLPLDEVFFAGESAAAFAEGCPAAHACADKPALMAALAAFVRDGGIGAGDTVLLKGSRGMKLEEVYERLKRLLTEAAPPASGGEPPCATKLYVDISALGHNLAALRRALPPETALMPVIKANAYGAGADIVANIFRDCRYMAVADAQEAVRLRAVFPGAEMVLLYQPAKDAIPAIVAHDLIAGLCDADFARALSDAAVAAGRRARVHVEIDTGMGRLGVQPEEAADFAAELRALPGLTLHGVYTHYACADSPAEEDAAFTREQTARFCAAAAAVEAVCGPVLKHACAGAAVFTQPDAHFDLVRPGYMLYGYYPHPALRRHVELRPALKLVSRVLYVKRVPAGTPVSYNRTFVTSRESVIATVAAGYSDGVSRLLSNRGHCVVNGQRAPIVGNVCMDVTMLDVTDISGAVRPGDEVAVFDNRNVTVEEIAELCGTIGYELITQITERAERVEGF